MLENNVYKKAIFACVLVCIYLFLFRFLRLFPFLPMSLKISWILEGAEKLLDYREYYCGLKYFSLYAGALSPCTMRVV